MASLIAKIWTRLCTGRKVPLSIMIVGLDNSGKTSILNSLASLNNFNNQQAANGPQTSQIEEGNSKQQSIHNQDHRTTSASSSRRNAESSVNIMPTVGYNYERIQYKRLTITVLDFSGQNRYRNLWQEFYNGVDAIVFVIDSSDLIRLVVARDELETMLNHPYFSTLQQPSSSSSSSSQAPAMASNNLWTQKQIKISQGKLIQSPLDLSSLSSSSSLSNCNTAISNQLSKTSSTTTKEQIKKMDNNNSSSSQLTSISGRRTKVPILFLANKADLANSVDIEVISKALGLNQLPLERHPWFIQATSVNLAQGIVEGFDWLMSQLSSVN